MQAVAEPAQGKVVASAAGVKRAGNTVATPKAPSVPGKLYFGFCEEVVRALQKIVGDGGGDTSGEGRGLCKIEFDAATKLPVTPIQVLGHPTSICCLVLSIVACVASQPPGKDLLCQWGCVLLPGVLHLLKFLHCSRSGMLA